MLYGLRAWDAAGNAARRGPARAPAPPRSTPGGRALRDATPPVLGKRARAAEPPAPASLAAGGAEGGVSGMAPGAHPRGGKRARPAKLSAPARPAMCAGAAGQPDGGDPGGPGGPSAPGALQAAAQGQAARCGGAAAGPNQAPAPVNHNWADIAYQVLRDAQPRRFLTFGGILRCAAACQ